MKVALSEVNEECATKNFYVFAIEGKGKHPVRILDKKGFIKVQRMMEKLFFVKREATGMWVSQMLGRTGDLSAGCHPRPGLLYLRRSRVMDFSGSVDLDKIMMLMEVEMQMINPSDDVIIVGAKNSL